MKKIISLLLVIVTVFFAVIPVCALSTPQSYITSAKTPTEKTMLKFSKSFSGSYKNAPTPPIVVGDTLIVVSGVKLYKLDAKTGKEIASAKMQGSIGYAIVSPAYADGKIFVQLDNGTVQAFDYKTMKSLWVYKDSLGGQSLCPITYDSGYIYTGFWNGEEDYADYVCLSVKDEDTKKETEAKKAKWTYKSKGGFYMAGCAVLKNFVVLGKDDGKSSYTGDSKILSLNKSTGKAVSTLSVKGDIRSTPCYDSQTKAFYIASKAGYVYKFKTDSSSGKLSSLKSYKAVGSVTASPTVYKGRIYVGCQSGKSGKFLVINASDMKLIYQSDMNGYPQAAALVSTGYGDKIYVYLTYNAKPGGITMFEDSAGQKSAKKTELFTPADNMSQYCISPIAAGSDGTLYYKNDSGNIMAVTKKSTNIFTDLIDEFFAFLRKLLGK
ncbi:MAG: PQQ-binding-like beta-propeller repeat protein [Acutalibacteraceae bacterium]